MKALENIKAELQSRIDKIDKAEEKTEYQKMLIKVYFGLLDLVKEQYDYMGLPRLTLRDVLNGITGDTSWKKTHYEVIGAKTGKVLYRSWNKGHRKLPEEYLDMPITTMDGKYHIEPRVVFMDNLSPWKDMKQYLLCYYEITISGV